eukprot:gb/GFBE01062738.1/.p1 GENE.gb/GFBE01062738.1/~~gb/GFBE01062738.1/.p1  ORF type:complete len:310 (+),score=54.25 gb/GFBE01062738.1/:1-930(+)
MALPVGRVSGAALVNLPKPVVAGSPDSKQQLIEFCEHKCGRPFQEGDIVYNTMHYSTGIQSMVQLAWTGGQEFAGELAKTVIEAERNAARQALQTYQSEVDALVQSRKRKAPGMSPGSLAPPPRPMKVAKVPPGMLDNPSFQIPDGSAAANTTNKSALNTTCSKIIRRTMDKNDCTYETNQVDGGFQATVRTPCLPGVWANRAFAGEVHQRKQDAEQSAAGIALAAIQRDVSLMAKYAAPPKVKTWTPNGGGKGKGKGTPAPQMPPSSAQWAGHQHVYQQPGQGQGWDVMPAMTMGFGGCGGGMMAPQW